METKSSRFYNFTPSGLLVPLSSAAEAVEALGEKGFVWFNFFNPDRKELSALESVPGIHPLSVEDCFDNRQVPKIEFFSSNTFIIFNAFTYVDKKLKVDEINLFLGKNFLITVSGHDSEGRKPLDGIPAIVMNDIKNAAQGPAYLMHMVLDNLVDQKYQAFDQMEDELDTAEELIMDDAGNFNPQELIRLRRDLLTLRKSLFHEREIFVKICRKDSPFVPEKSIVQYRDISDHLSKFFELSETYHEIETSLMELYTSLLNNLMTKMSNETNLSVRRLTMIATIFMPLTLISGILGMSEWTMMTGTGNWKLSYPLFLAGMGIIAVINYLLIKRLDRRNNYK